MKKSSNEERLQDRKSDQLFEGVIRHGIGVCSLSVELLLRQCRHFGNFPKILLDKLNNNS